MAFRRFAPSRGRSNSFRSRSRFNKNRTREPRRTGHWQRANFNLISTNVVDTGTSVSNIVVPIAQIKDRVSDSTIGTGRALAEMAKFCEVGGVVFDWNFYLGDVSLDDDTGLWSIQQQIILVSDRLDSDGNPCAIDFNWFNSQTPITIASSQSVDDEDQEQPTRVHWRHSRNLVGGAYASNTTGRFYPSQNVVSLQGSANLRLRLRLDDEHCLAFHVPTFLANSGGAELLGAAVTITIAGSLYYRMRFS